MDRKTALQYIKIEFAKYGECTREAMRIYCENRISRKAFDEMAAIGMKIYRAQQQKAISK